LHALCDLPAPERPPHEYLNAPPDNVLSYYDGRRFKVAPYQRVTDVHLLFIRDVSVEHGLVFDPAPTDDAEAQRNALRAAIAADKIEFDPLAGAVIDHTRAAVWNAKRTDYDRTPVHGHFDALAALAIMWRHVFSVRNKSPFPPSHVGKSEADYHVTEQMKNSMSETARAVEKALTHDPRAPHGNGHAKPNGNGRVFVRSRNEGWRRR